MKFGQLLGITVISAMVGLVLSNLILPAIVSDIDYEGLSLSDSSNLSSWASILITLLGLVAAIPLLGKYLQIGPLYLVLALSFSLTIVFLCGGSFLYLYYTHPEVYEGSTTGLRLVKFYTHPTLVSLTLGDPQPIWWISTGMFVFLFLSGAYILNEIGEAT